MKIIWTRSKKAALAMAAVAAMLLFATPFAMTSDAAVPAIEVTATGTGTSVTQTDVQNALTAAGLDKNNDTYTVTFMNNPLSIAIRAFDGCSGLIGTTGSAEGTLKIPSTVVSIDNRAFLDCTGITALDFSSASGLTIGNYAFSNTGITGTLTISGVTVIGPGAFSDCEGITGTIIIPGSVGYIGISAFLNCPGIDAFVFKGATWMGDQIVITSTPSFYHSDDLAHYTAQPGLPMPSFMYNDAYGYITSFRINGQSGIIDQAAKTVTVRVPNGTDLTNLAPEIGFIGGSITPSSGAGTNFSAGTVSYTLLSTGGMPYTYQVTVVCLPGLEITGGTLGTDYTYSGGVLRITQDGTYNISMAPGVTTTPDRIVVVTGVTANITLNDVSIDVRANVTQCAFDMTGANVDLTIRGNNNLFSGNDRAGLEVPAGSVLTIDGGASDVLNASSGLGGAGIGGGYGSNGGTITIAGGIVNATSRDGAGIGGGVEHSAGTVNITGGDVTATGLGFGSGIGGGYGLTGGNGGTVNISGGLVTARGNNIGAGIGGGGGGAVKAGDGGSLIVTGGRVVAVSSSGAGIGAGALMGVGTVNASGSFEINGDCIVFTNMLQPAGADLTLTKGVLLIDTAGVVYGEVTLKENINVLVGCTFTVPSSSKLTLDGVFTSWGTLNIGLRADGSPSIDASEVRPSNGRLNITGTVLPASVSKASDLTGLKQTVIQSAADITSDFSSVSSDAVPPSDYIVFSMGVYLNTYQVGYALAWLENESGTFTIPDGETFEVDIPLQNMPGNPAWDGFSLTKAGGGTLILSESNTYGGTTYVTLGTLKITDVNALRFSSQIIFDENLFPDTAVFDIGTLQGLDLLDLTMKDTSTLRIDVDGLASGLYELITATSLTLGDYDVIFDNGTMNMNYELPVSGNTLQLKAFFNTVAKKEYYIKSSAASGATISPSGVTIVTFGSDLSFTFSAASVIVDGMALSQSEVDKGSYTFSKVMANHSISVSGQGKKAPVVVTAGITGGNGTILYSADGSPFAPYTDDVVLREGSTVIFKAIADDGYQFKGWLLNGTASSTPELTVPNIASPLSLLAQFGVSDASSADSGGISIVVIAAIVVVAVIIVAAAAVFIHKGKAG